MGLTWANYLVELGVVPELLPAEGHVPRQLVWVPGQGPAAALGSPHLSEEQQRNQKDKDVNVRHNTKELNAVHALPGGDMLMSRRGP